MLRVSRTLLARSGRLLHGLRKPGCGGCKPGLLSGSPLIWQPAGFKQGRSPPTAAGPSKGKARGGARRETNYAIPMTPCQTHGGSVQHMVAAVMGARHRSAIASPAMSSSCEIWPGHLSRATPNTPGSQKLGAQLNCWCPSGSLLTASRASREAFRGRWSPRARRS
jgi:hypothetical protein